MNTKLEIRAARTRLGMKKQDMADYLGISCGQYKTRELGQVRFSDKEKAAMTKLFGWGYRQMNEILYDGELPDFCGDGITER